MNFIKTIIFYIKTEEIWARHDYV